MQGPWKASWPAYFFDDGSIYSVFQAVAKLGAPAIALLHCENWEIALVLQKQLMDAGRTDMGAWDDRSPAFTEVGHARTYLYYARIAGCPHLHRALHNDGYRRRNRESQSRRLDGLQ